MTTSDGRTVFGEDVPHRDDLDAKVTSILTKQNRFLKVVDANGDRTRPAIIVDEPTRDISLKPDPALTRFSGGIVVPVDYVKRQYLFPEKMPAGIALPDILYVSRSDDGTAKVMPLDVKGKRLRDRRKVERNYISAAQVTGWNAYSLFMRSETVNRMVRTAASALGCVPDRFTFTDGALVMEQEEGPNREFSEFLASSGLFGKGRVLNIGRESVRIREEGLEKAGDGAYRLEEGLEGSRAFCRPMKRTTGFKLWQSQTRNQVKQGVNYPSMVSVIRGFDEEGLPAYSRKFSPEEGLLLNYDRRLEHRLTQLKELRETKDLVVLQTVTRERLQEARERIRHLEQEKEAVEERIGELSREETTRQVSLEKRLSEALATNPLIRALDRAAFDVPEAVVTKTKRELGLLERGIGRSPPPYNRELLKQKAHEALAQVEKGGFRPRGGNELTGPMGDYLRTAYGTDITTIRESLAERQKNGGKDPNLVKQFLKYHVKEQRRKLLASREAEAHYLDICGSTPADRSAALSSRGVQQAKVYLRLAEEGLIASEEGLFKGVGEKAEMYEGLGRKVMDRRTGYRRGMESHAKGGNGGTRGALPNWFATYLENRAFGAANITGFLRGKRNIERVLCALEEDADAALKACESYRREMRQTVDEYDSWTGTLDRISESIGQKMVEERRYEKLLRRIAVERAALVGDPELFEDAERIAELKKLSEKQIEVLNAEYVKRKKRMVNEFRVFKKAHDGIMRALPYEVENGKVREIYFDINPGRSTIYRVTVLPVILLGEQN